ncbi:NACHT domain-containing NTPase [Streptomyces sp. JJ36]|uniref:NACHT domain-containing protein n=1 Tax=Streptomyces sp. JJ36 TaxID=2736645 RepID=UPI001F37C8ED|nr:NACHT domain-containing protein [Streptomyces sp. JJ36]MCF6523682.1 NACHT domain-containing protein [Streptomyces sp. JJ36]
MDAGTVGVRLASSAVGPLVKRLFATGEPGAGLVERPVRVSALVSFRGEQRTLGEREVRKVAHELVERALRAAGPGERPVPEGEEQAVAAALARTLLTLGVLRMEDVQAVRLGHRAFARVLRETAPAATRDVGADAERFHDALLETACLHILHFFTRRSTFVARTLVAQSRDLADTVGRLDLLLERVPPQSAVDLRFERRYAEVTARRHRSLTIYGLDLREARAWPLDTAYLSLAAVERQRYGRHDRDAEGSLLTDPPGPAEYALPAERALAGHERVLLRGVAGSGKTTLVQWLAVTAAHQEPPPELSYLLGRVPFVLPLRTLTRGGAELPLPDRFLAAAGCPVAGAQPPGWVDRVLTAGRGLLLVDGIDEVPERERERTRRWLYDLLDAFPGNLWLVTSRPSAVAEDWLAGADFTEVSLAPMGRPEVAAFAERWHRAAGAPPELAETLLTEVRGRPDLARLATNPLMCGLLCALHRERRGFLPRGRKALYDAALSMLLERRDRERDMGRPDGLDLDAETRTELLQKLAYWLIRNGRAEMTRQDAVELVDRVLPAIPRAAGQGSAEEVFRHLLLRSGLLREPAPEAVDFLHRTFQDYLGAREAVEERDVDLLVRHAHLDQWEDVLRMAVAHARPDERARLLRTLLSRAAEEPEHRTRLHLLAMACLEHATRLDPEVAEEVRDRAAELIPPQRIDDAKRLAAAGPLVLGLLPGPGRLSSDEAVAVAHTAAQLGGDAALPVLSRYRDHPSPGVAQQLGGHWDRFDTGTYAREIVAHLTDRPGAYVTVRSAAERDALHRLGGARSVAVHGDFGAKEVLAVLRPGSGALQLRIARNALLADLRFLRAWASLRELELSDCPRVRDLAPLADLAITGLALHAMPGLDPSWSGLRRLTGLESLALGVGVPRLALSALSPKAPLGSLSVAGEAPDLTAVGRLTRLSMLDLELAEGLRPEDWEALCRHPALRLLRLAPEHPRALEQAGLSAGGITGVTLRGGREPDALGRLAALFPELQSLLVTSTEPVDLAPLAGHPRLRVVTVRAPRVAHAERLPAHVTVSTLPCAV